VLKWWLSSWSLLPAGAEARWGRASPPGCLGFAPPARMGPAAAMGNSHQVPPDMGVDRFMYLPVSSAARNNNFVQEGLSKAI